MSKKSSLHTRRGFSQRVVETRSLRKRFLIVCEGEKTEPNYFRGFRAPGRTVDIRGIGYNTDSLVREAIRIMKQDEYDQVWCVFDRDSFPAKNFNAAFELARTNNIQIAYSNEAFELWYLLHYDYHQSAIPRTDYIKILSSKLGKRYEKNSETIFDDLENKVQTAIRNARRLLTNYGPQNPEKDNPSTTVHLLVTELLNP